MKIQVVSDTHNEFGIIPKFYDPMIETKADVLVLAGDISGYRDIFNDLVDIQEASGKKVIYVPGNHEYYGTRKARMDVTFNDFNLVNSNLHVLMEDDILIDGIRFLGTTGWWDGSGGTIDGLVKLGLNDFSMIYDLMDDENRDGVKWGETARSYLDSRMGWLRENEPDTKLCVITHHYPHYQSIDPRFAGNKLNVCFGNRWEWLIEKHQPEVWIHGHTHSSFDYKVGDTRVVCNPQGYPEEYCLPKVGVNVGYDGVLSPDDLDVFQSTENRNYDPTKVIEIC